MKIKFFVSLWLSSVIFKVLNQECKQLYRKLERTSIKQISARAHRSFNETCLNIYIYIYIYYECNYNIANKLVFHFGLLITMHL